MIEMTEIQQLLYFTVNSSVEIEIRCLLYLIFCKFQDLAIALDNNYLGTSYSYYLPVLCSVSTFREDATVN